MANFMEFKASEIENAIGGTTDIMLDKEIRNVDFDNGYITVYFDGKSGKEEDCFYIVLSVDEVKKIGKLLLSNEFDKGYAQANKEMDDSLGIKDGE